MAFADDLLKDAYHLAGRGGKSPKQSSLRRAVPTAYYALFHLLIADFVANWRLKDQQSRLGRMFDDGKMRTPLRLKDKTKPTLVETEVQKLIQAFSQLYEDRCTADYDIGKVWSRTDVTNTLRVAEEAFQIWRAIRKEKPAQNHLLSMFGARQN